MTFLVPWIAAMPTLILTLPQPTTPAASQQLARGFLYKTLTLDDETYAYCVYVPPDYSTEQRWPLILALCGSGERGTDGFLRLTSESGAPFAPPPGYPRDRRDAAVPA
jgi:predicted peptidase